MCDVIASHGSSNASGSTDLRGSLADPVHLVPELAASGGQTGEGLLQGDAGMRGPLLHDFTQPHHMLRLRLELQLSCHWLKGIQNLLWGQQRQEEVAIACNITRINTSDNDI